MRTCKVVIPGALSPEELKQRGGGGDDGPLVVYCTVGYRSSLEARKIVAETGREDVHSMTGILPWAHAGGELVDPTTHAPTRRLHCFGGKWAALAPADCETVVFPTIAGARALLPTIWAVVKDTVGGWWSGRGGQS